MSLLVCAACFAIAFTAAFGCLALAVRYVVWRRQRAEAKRLPLSGQEKRAIVGGMALVGAVGVSLAVGVGWRGLHGVPSRSVTERSATIPNATPTEPDDPGPVLTEPDPTPPVRYTGERQREFERRWRVVWDEAGPAPDRATSVPVVGYQSGGTTFSSRWRTPPNASKEDNLRAGK